MKSIGLNVSLQIAKMPRRLVEFVEKRPPMGRVCARPTCQLLQVKIGRVLDQFDEPDKGRHENLPLNETKEKRLVADECAAMAIRAALVLSRTMDQPRDG